MESPAVTEARRAFEHNHTPEQMRAIVDRVSTLEARANTLRVAYLVAPLLIGAAVVYLTLALNPFGDPKSGADKWSKALGAFLALWSPFFALVLPKVEFKGKDYSDIVNKAPLTVDLIGINRALALPSEKFDKYLKFFDAAAKALAVYLLL